MSNQDIKSQTITDDPSIGIAHAWDGPAVIGGDLNQPQKTIRHRTLIEQGWLSAQELHHRTNPDEK